MWCFFKSAVDDDCLRPRGREFHKFGAATEKARSPYVLSLFVGHIGHLARKTKVCGQWCEIAADPSCSLGLDPAGLYMAPTVLCTGHDIPQGASKTDAELV